jgi:peptidoglycan/xylan/chitin deacetylase (PgdA/CDA1 family)
MLLLLYALLLEPPPLGWVVAFLFVYVTYATLGVVVPRLGVYADIVWRGEPGRKLVALTFDDGPHPRTTRRVLEILAERGARATFCVVGRKVEQWPDVVREIHDAGHELALHGYVHDRLYCFRPPHFVKVDIQRSQRLIQRIAGVIPKRFRPPIGYVSHRTGSGAKRAGVSIVGWSARGIDGIGATDPVRVVRRIERDIEDGAIILLHDAAEHDDFEPASIEALPALLDAIDARGLRPVTLEELLEPNIAAQPASASRLPIT